jgi:hypothetical protein
VDILLLGNSRPLPVGAGDLGVLPDRFFNLALTGESLRSSVAALEYLGARGKLPKRSRPRDWCNSVCLGMMTQGA